MHRLTPRLRTLSSAPSSWSIRHHSHGAAPPSFHPTLVTSADTNAPFADPALASAPYLPQSPDAAPLDASDPATSETPHDLSADERQLLESIIRVDQAGELGANYIYRGQLAVLSMSPNHKHSADLVQDMWDGEKKHIAALDKVASQHGVRPTALYPLWKAAGWALGAGTALLGPRAAMACTEAVETVIGEHYDAQLATLSDPKQFSSTHPSAALLKKVIHEFKEDELGHLETAVENEAQMAPAHALLSAVIAGGCRVAIAVSEKV